MLIELISTLGGIGAFGWGLGKAVPYVKEKQSIALIEETLTRVINGENVFEQEEDYGDDFYKRQKFTYKHKNLRIFLQSTSIYTNCILYDTDINGNTEFFSFTYKTDTKELTEVKEKSEYYRKRNYYEQHADLFRRFIDKVRETDWLNKEKEERHWLLTKYKTEEKINVKDSFQQKQQQDYIKELPSNLQKLYNQYQQYYQFVFQHKEFLELEENHELERDEEQIQKLLMAYCQLESFHQEQAKEEVIQRMTEKIHALFLKHEKIHQKNLREFQRISETMKA